MFGDGDGDCGFWWFVEVGCDCDFCVGGGVVCILGEFVGVVGGCCVCCDGCCYDCCEGD